MLRRTGVRPRYPQQYRQAHAGDEVAHQSQIDPDELAGHITPRTRGIILNTPHNPTGAVYRPETLEAIARLVMRHGLTCVFDECYDELVYAPAIHSNIVRLMPEMKSRTNLRSILTNWPVTSRRERAGSFSIRRITRPEPCIGQRRSRPSRGWSCATA